MSSIHVFTCSPLLVVIIQPIISEMLPIIILHSLILIYIPFVGRDKNELIQNTKKATSICFLSADSSTP